MSNEAAPASSLTDKEREAIAQMPYEEARDKLIQAVQALEAGGLNLDQSMRQWEIGEALAKRCAEPAWRGPSPSSTPRRPSRPPRPTPQERKTIWPEHPSRHSRSPRLWTFHRNVPSNGLSPNNQVRLPVMSSPYCVYNGDSLPQ